MRAMRTAGTILISKKEWERSNVRAVGVANFSKFEQMFNENVQ